MPTATASHTTSLRAALGSSSGLPDCAVQLEEDGTGNGASLDSGVSARADDARPDPAATDWAFEAARNRALRTRPAQTCFIIYAIRSWEAKEYVGVTVSLRMRIARDIGDALHRPHLGGPGSLLDAIRRAFNAGKTFEQAFQVRTVALALTEDDARRLEREWIERIGSMSPRGYNLMPGGRSLGGPFNAKPVTIRHPAKGALHYDSLMKAIDSINAMRIGTGEAPLGLFTVYMRLRMGWPAEEALGLWAPADRRRARAEFVWRGRRYTSHRALARAAGQRSGAAADRRLLSPRRARDHGGGRGGDAGGGRPAGFFWLAGRGDRGDPLDRRGRRYPGAALAWRRL